MYLVGGARVCASVCFWRSADKLKKSVLPLPLSPPSLSPPPSLPLPPPWVSVPGTHPTQAMVGILMSRTEGCCERPLSSCSGHVCSLFSSLCPQVGLAGGLRSSVCDVERYSTAPKSSLTSNLYANRLSVVFSSKEDAASKGSGRCFQKHTGCSLGLASCSHACLALIWSRVLPCGVVHGTLRKGGCLS